MSVKIVGQDFKQVEVLKEIFQKNQDHVFMLILSYDRHTKDKCYCLHCYPSWHKLFCKPKPKPRLVSSNVKSISASQVSSYDTTRDKPVVATNMNQLAFGSILPGYMPLSDRQCKQLIQFLKQSMNIVVSTNTKSGTEIQASSWYTPMNSNQFVGSSINLANNVYTDQSYSSNHWIVDRGATDHRTPFAHLLHNVTSFQSTLHR